MKKQFLPFEEAREITRSLGLKTVENWREWCKSEDKMKYIPSYPNEVYKNNGWRDWGDWLGTGTVANFKKEYLPFEEARMFVHSLKLKKQSEWREWARSENRSENIPSTPEGVYKNDGWIGFGDWLGTGRIATRSREYLSFEEARKYTRSLNLNTAKEWSKWCQSGKKPNNIPASPNYIYKEKGWITWNDWLGNENKIYLPFEKARAFARSLALKSSSEWLELFRSGKIPEDIPAYPDRIYKLKGWNGWEDWLGGCPRMYLSVIILI